MVVVVGAVVVVVVAGPADGGVTNGVDSGSDVQAAAPTKKTMSKAIRRMTGDRFLEGESRPTGDRAKVIPGGLLTGNVRRVQGGGVALTSGGQTPTGMSRSSSQS